MATKTNTIEKHANSNPKKTPLKVLCAKAVTSQADWPDKEEFLDVVYWARQVFGIILGMIWGIIPLKGLLGIVLFSGLSCAVVYIYAINFQKVDEEVYGGAWEIVKEGFMTSFAGFLVAWIIFYTGIHYDTIMAEAEKLHSL